MKVAEKTRLAECRSHEWHIHRSEKWEEQMNGIRAKLAMAALLATGVGPIFSGSATAQTPTEEQCSLAVVSRLAGNSQNVCETRVVQDLAKRGHAFEQNQLGIASML